MKEKVISLFLLILALTFSICSCSRSGSDSGVSVSVKIAVMDSETGYSGVIYQNPSYSYKPGSPTVDGVLNALTKEGKIQYYYDGSFIKINDFSFFDALDNSYTRAWIVKINGVTPTNGVYSDIAEGDAIEMTYSVFVH